MELGQIFEYLHPHLIILSHPLQTVRELGQLFEYHTNLIIPLASSVSSGYVMIVICLNTSNPIILSHSLQPVRELQVVQLSEYI